jgi:tetratricopeptide (TPR) repeat protein
MANARFPCRRWSCLTHWLGDQDTATALLEESLALYETIEDQRQCARVLLLLGWITRRHGAFATTIPALQESVAMSRSQGDRLSMSLALTNLGIHAYQQGERDRAQALHEEALALQESLGHPWPLATTWYHLGLLAQEAGDDRLAHALYTDSLVLTRALGFRGLLAYLLEAFASLAVLQDRAARGALLAAAAAALRLKLGVLHPAYYMRPKLERTVAGAKQVLGDQTYGEVWAAGQALTLEQAIAEAMEHRIPTTASACSRRCGCHN